MCAKFDEERVLATTEQEKEENAKAKQNHIEQVMNDRGVNVTGNTMAEHSAGHPSADGMSNILNITIDGMHQAKFRCGQLSM